MRTIPFEPQVSFPVRFTKPVKKKKDPIVGHHPECLVIKETLAPSIRSRMKSGSVISLILMHKVPSSIPVLAMRFLFIQALPVGWIVLQKEKKWTVISDERLCETTKFNRDQR